MNDEDEVIALQVMSRRLWPGDWVDVERYLPLLADEASVRCSIATIQPTCSGETSHVIERIEMGEELPGSWHQQSNGGRRVWFAVSGEIEAR